MNQAVDNVIIKVLVANKTDVTLKNELHFKNKVIQPGPSAMNCLAEHGLAFSVVIIKDNQQDRYLFDMGGLKKTIINNIKTFKIKPSEFKRVMLSHGHYDHWGAIIEISKFLSDETEFILNPEGLRPRFSLGKELTGTKIDLANLDLQKLKKEKKIRQLPPFPEKKFQEVVNEKNFKLTYTNNPVKIEPGVITSGEIKIFEPDEVTKGMLVKKSEKFYYDTFRDEISLYINVKDKGLIILTGCGHCGLINTIKHGQALTGVENIYAIIGGLHQNWASAEHIKKTINILKDLNPTLISGLHCTGFKFVAECMRQMPIRTALAVVGTTYFF